MLYFENYLTNCDKYVTLWLGSNYTVRPVMVNQLDTGKRAKILYLLLEGNSMRGICRMEGVNWRTVEKLQNDAARAARRYHRKYVDAVAVATIQMDELWSFCYAKQKRLANLTNQSTTAGDVWTWLALESDTKLILSYRVDDRTDRSCRRFMKDLAQRVEYDEDLEIFTDGNPSYPRAIRKYFRDGISYSQLVKTIKDGQPMIKDRQIYGKRRSNRSTTSYVERANLTVRMSNRRYSRKTSAFSKKIENHRASVDLFIMNYNWIRVHETLGTAPAVAARLARQPYSLERLVRRIDRMNARERRKKQRREKRRIRFQIK